MMDDSHLMCSGTMTLGVDNQSFIRFPFCTICALILKLFIRNIHFYFDGSFA